MDRRPPDRPHFVQADRKASARELPRRLGAGKAASDDGDFLHGQESTELVVPEELCEGPHQLEAGDFSTVRLKEQSSSMQEW